MDEEEEEARKGRADEKVSASMSSSPPPLFCLAFIRPSESEQRKREQGRSASSQSIVPNQANQPPWLGNWFCKKKFGKFPLLISWQTKQTISFWFCISGLVNNNLCIGRALPEGRKGERDKGGNERSAASAVAEITTRTRAGSGAAELL